MRRFSCIVVTGITALSFLVSCGGGGGGASSAAGGGGGILSGVGSFFSSLFGAKGGSFSKSYGGDDDSTAYAVRQTSDGGYIVAGQTYAFGTGLSDVWVLKLNSDGSVAWQKAYGGDDDETAYAVQQTADGGYIVAGETYSTGAGNSDMLVMKLKGDGTPEWQNTYGDVGSDSARSVQQTADGGYVVAGYTNDGSSSDIWVLKLGSDGRVAWQKAYSGNVEESANSIQQTADGGYIVAGEAYSYDSSHSMLVLKLDGSGAVAWQRTYSNSYYDVARAVQQTLDGGYIVAGLTSQGDSNAWVLKLGSAGDIVWQKSYGGSDDDAASSIRQTPDGGYIFAGDTKSFGSGGSDAWVLKLGSAGDIVWQKSYGGSADDSAKAVETAPDGGYLFAGSTASSNSGNTEAWVLKMNSSGATRSAGTDTNATAADTHAAVAASSGAVSVTNVAPVPAGLIVINTNTTVS